MSSLSPTFNPSNQSYHNGSFWPVLSGMIHEGLEIWNYGQQAAALREAILGPIAQFGCPIELYIRDGAGKLIEYESPTGKKGCRYQAWSAAVVMDLTAEQ
jgi:glycogen debranching enzyme